MAGATMATLARFGWRWAAAAYALIPLTLGVVGLILAGQEARQNI